MTDPTTPEPAAMPAEPTPYVAAAEPAPYSAPATTARPYNVLSIIALIAAFVLAPVGIILGAIALGQIRKTGEQGHGLAMAGLIIGIVFTILYLIGIIIGVVFYFLTVIAVTGGGTVTGY